MPIRRWYHLNPRRYRHLRKRLSPFAGLFCGNFRSKSQLQKNWSALDWFTSPLKKIEINKNKLWSFCKVNALRGLVCNIQEESAMLKFQEKKEKISKIIENWQFRRLTLPEKITVIKSLLASQLVYILSPLPTPSDCLKEINSLLHKFLWNGKCDKIKRTHVINDYAKRGLKMLDI